MIRRPPRSTQSRSSAASDVYKRQALDHWYRPRTPALIGGLELLRAADGEGGDHVQAKSRGVVVVDEKDDIGSMGLHPRLGRLIALEQRLPVWLSSLAQIERGADGGHMGGIDAGGNPGHYLASGFFWPI